MWILSNSSGRTYFVSGDKDIHSLGRDASCSLQIENDKSISRVHAYLKPSPEKLIVVDTGSRYGIFVNEGISSLVRLSANADVELKNGDTVQFGRFDCKWTVEKKSLNALTSCLKGEEAEKWRQNMQILCGNILQSWSSSSTHLVMPEVIITMKALLALVSGVPIVLPEYFAALLESIQKGTVAPKVEHFLPPIREENLTEQNCSLHPDKERRLVFAGKRFIFLSQEVMARYEAVIQMAGGCCVNIETSTPSQHSYVQLGTIVVSSETKPGAREWVNVEKIEKKLKEKGCRFIPEKEIALAIIFKSTRKFCNPRYDFTADFLTATSQNNLGGKILVEDTPNFVKPPLDRSHIELPETVPDPNSSVTVNEEILSNPHVECEEVIEIPSSFEEAIMEEQPEVPQKTEEAQKTEKRKRTTWLTAEKDNTPPRKTPKKNEAHVEVNSLGRENRPVRNAPPSASSGEKRKLRGLLDDPDAFEAPVRKKNRKMTPEKSQHVTQQSQASSSSTPLSRFSSAADLSNIPPSVTKSSGWLSKKFFQISLNDSEVDGQVKEEEDENYNWVNTLKTAVKVHSKDMDGSTVSVIRDITNDTVDSTVSNTSVNFKAFKQKQKFISQKSVEKLVQINPKSFD